MSAAPSDREQFEFLSKLLSFRIDKRGRQVANAGVPRDAGAEELQ